MKLCMRTQAVASFLACVLVSGCAVHERVTSVDNTFLEDVDISSKRPNLPFEHAWVDPTFKKSNFLSVYFKPVRTEYLNNNTWELSASTFVTSREDYMQYAREIAEHFQSELMTKAQQTKEKRLGLAKAPDSDSLVVEIALTELQLSHPVARAGAMVAPVPGTGPALSAVSDPHVAFAARVYDGSTGKLVATVADRKFAPTRIIDLNKLTVSSSAREITSLWADTITAALQGDGKTKIAEKKLDWMPW